MTEYNKEKLNKVGGRIALSSDDIMQIEKKFSVDLGNKSINIKQWLANYLQVNLDYRVAMSPEEKALKNFEKLLNTFGNVNPQIAEIGNKLLSEMKKGIR